MLRTSVVVRVPAKINLLLAVGGVRPDGFHDLATVFHAVGLYDEIVVTAGIPGAGISLAVAGTNAQGVPLDRHNLAWRAVELLAAREGITPDVHLELRKAIPVAGGMAGGSADAAGALVACDHLWTDNGRRPIGREALEPLAAQLGSDVPFALHGGTFVGLGRGERLTPALARGELHWVIAIADGELSTPEVYAECDRLRGSSVVPEPFVPDELMAALAAGDAVAVGRAMRNDLQPAAIALRPSLARTLRVGEELGALGSLVSGSGPSCVFLARDADHATDLAVGLSGADVCRSVRRTVGPVPGARVVGEH